MCWIDLLLWRCSGGEFICECHVQSGRWFAPGYADAADGAHHGQIVAQERTRSENGDLRLRPHRTPQRIRQTRHPSWNSEKNSGALDLFIHLNQSISNFFFFNSYFFKIIINFYHYFIFTVAKNSSSTSSSIEFQTNSLNWFHSRWNTDWLDRSRIAPLPIGWPNTILHHSSTKERYTISRLRVLDTVSLLMSSVIRSIQFQFNINIHHGWTVIWMIRCLRPSQWQHHGEINGTPLSHRFRQVSGRCADVRQFQARSNAIRAHLGHGLRHQRWWQTFAKVPAFRRSVLSSKT